MHITIMDTIRFNYLILSQLWEFLFQTRHKIYLAIFTGNHYSILVQEGITGSVKYNWLTTAHLSSAKTPKLFLQYVTLKKIGSKVGVNSISKWWKICIDLKVDFWNRMDNGSNQLDCMARSGNGIWKSVSLIVHPLWIFDKAWLTPFEVQRWFSGIFGVRTIDWFKDRNSMHKIWELNENLMKQKYRMHNTYVQVGHFWWGDLKLSHDISHIIWANVF